MWYTYTMKDYSAVKNGMIKYAGKGMELEKNHPEQGNPDLKTQT